MILNKGWSCPKSSVQNWNFRWKPLQINCFYYYSNYSSQFIRIRGFCYTWSKLWATFNSRDELGKWSLLHCIGKLGRWTLLSVSKIDDEPAIKTEIFEHIKALGDNKRLIMEKDYHRNPHFSLKKGLHWNEYGFWVLKDHVMKVLNCLQETVIPILLKALWQSDSRS
jgi:hypothetical protein